MHVHHYNYYVGDPMAVTNCHLSLQAYQLLFDKTYPGPNSFVEVIIIIIYHRCPLRRYVYDILQST